MEIQTQTTDHLPVDLSTTNGPKPVSRSDSTVSTDMAQSEDLESSISSSAGSSGESNGPVEAAAEPIATTAAPDTTSTIVEDVVKEDEVQAEQEARRKAAAAEKAKQALYGNRTDNSNSRRGGMIVRSVRESLNPTCCQKLREAARRRRAACAPDQQSLSVQFASLEIREYPIILGDNPGGLSGPPLSIDWDHMTSCCVSIDEYERTHPTRRSNFEMRIPSCIRVNTLRKAGYSKEEIRLLCKPINICRAQRLRTVSSLQLAPLQECAEKLVRKVANGITLGRKKRKERAFLEPFICIGEKPDFSSSVDLESNSDLLTVESGDCGKNNSDGACHSPASSLKSSLSSKIMAAGKMKPTVVL